ncbi:MAG: hypothetical protein VX794_07925 [Nitrospinota bacterium]|nr:hypothetical protein [Nitrospinota bacterium]
MNYRHLSSSTFHLLENVEHMVPMELPKEVSFILDELLERVGM